MLGIGHLNKGVGGHPLDRIGGSVAFGAAARSVLLFATKPDADESDPERVLAHVKSNLSPTAVALRYRVEGRIVEADGKAIETSGLTWLGEAPDIEAGSLLLRHDPAERPQRDLATETILGELEDGEQSWKAITAALQAEGVSEHTGRMARDELKRTGRIDRSKTGMAGSWTWRLAADIDESVDTDNHGKFEDADGKFDLAHDLGDHKFDRRIDPFDAATANVTAIFGEVEDVTDLLTGED